MAPEALDRLAAETDAAIMWPGSHGNTELFAQLRPVIDELRKAWADNVALVVACRWALDDLNAIWHLSIHTKDKLQAALGPHPGQPLLDRLERLEAVAEAARVVRKTPAYRPHLINASCHIRAAAALAAALDALDGGASPNG